MSSNKDLSYQLKIAYRKFKSYIYYNNYSAIDRFNISQFESEHFCKDNSFDPDKIDEFFNDLADKVIEGNLEDFTKDINVISLPKKMKENEGKEDEECKELKNFFTNFKTDQTSVDKINYFIKLPTESHILGVLWILRCGYILDDKLYKNCYSNRLNKEILNGLKEGKYAPNTFLFDPYFKKYESWRDNGLDEVKSILNKKQNTIMISLDLKEYYYSSRINFNQLKKDMKKARERLIQKKLGKNSSVDNNDEEINDFLNDFIEKVFENYHKKFSFKPSANEKDSDNSYMIPLGFLPSLIIANWNLQGFDQAILENVHPNYYGRYVDDILIVLPSHEKSDSHGKQHIEKLTLETVIKKYLTPCEDDPINNILQIKNNSKKNTYFIQNLPIFSLENENYNYEHLEIQQEKFKVYFFNHKNSQAIIDKFRKAIAVNSSEFRLLHGVELTAKNLKYDLYQMSYEDSINKLRGIHDFKLNKYEASKILSRLIDASKCFNTLDKKLQKEITSELMSAFSADALSFINLWEKIFSYLYINEEYTTLKKFIKQIIWLINNIDINDKSDSNKMHCKLKEDIESSLNESLKLFLYSSIVRVLSLKCNDQSKEIYKMLDKFLGYKKDSKDCAGNFLVASLQNNRLMKFPLQNTNEFLGAKIGENYDLIKPEYKDWGFFNGFSYPRYVKCYEVMLNEINKNIFTEDTESTYLDNFENIWDKCKKINFDFPCCATDKVNDEDKNNGFIKKIEFPHINAKYILREVCVDNEYKDDIKIGLINTKLNKEYCENRIKNKPNLHYKRFDKIINIINESIKKKVEFLLMPELYIPYEWIDKIIEVSRNHQMVMVFGVEYIVHNDIVKNCLMVSLPSKNKGYNSNILTYRLKNYYAPDEIRTISKLNKKDAKVKLPTYILYNWNGISFASYCCYEISDIVSRGLFKGKCDIVTVSEFNKDTKYFNNICESLSRDLFCYCISSNTSEYGGTSIIQPSSSEDKYIIQLKGGEEDYVVTYKLDISDLKDKKSRSYTADFSDTHFKPQPPGLNYFNKNLFDGLDEQDDEMKTLNAKIDYQNNKINKLNDEIKQAYNKKDKLCSEKEKICYKTIFKLKENMKSLENELKN